MKFALVGAGAAGKSFIARLPHLQQQLGPVAAGSHRLASRLVNTLKAGQAVKSMKELQADVILLCAPGRRAFEPLVANLNRAGLNWNGKTLIICDSDAFTTDIDAFRKAGAVTGSLNLLAESPHLYVAEGAPGALRVAKHLTQHMGAKLLQIRGDRVALYSAALTISSSLFTPLLESCVECVRASGIKGVAGAQVTEFLFSRSLRAYMHAGRKSWSGAVAAGDWRAVGNELEALRKWNPLIAEQYRDCARFALASYKRSAADSPLE